MPAPPILILNGVSSAGKSSLAEALLEALDLPYCSVSMDQFEAMARRIWPLPGAHAFYTTCLIPMMHQCVARFAVSGKGVVVDTLLADPVWLHDAVIQLADFDVVFIGVHCALLELQRRERERGDRRIGQAQAQLLLLHPLVQQRGGYDLDIDTTTTSPLECARQIIRNLQSGDAPTAFRRLRAQDWPEIGG